LELALLSVLQRIVIVKALLTKREAEMWEGTYDSYLFHRYL
jgi:hypothetical protein